MIRHKSSAIVKVADSGAYNRDHWKVSNQFRFLIRLAVACDAAKVDYDVQWITSRTVNPDYPGDIPYPASFDSTRNAAWLACQPRATITVTADKIPAAKPLPKAPVERRVVDWKPRFHEAEYKLDAYDTPKGKQPGFVIVHSSGLSLLCPSSTGEWGEGANYGDADPTGKNWRVQHTLSGLGFGVQTTLARAAKALLLAASHDVDWTKPAAEFDKPKSRAAGAEVLAAFGNPEQKRRAATVQHIAAKAAIEAAKPKVEGQCKMCGSIGIAGDECDCCETSDGLGPMILQPTQVAA